VRLSVPTVIEYVPRLDVVRISLVEIHFRVLVWGPISKFWAKLSRFWTFTLCHCHGQIVSVVKKSPKAQIGQSVHNAVEN